MIDADYFRRHAETCFRLARQCYNMEVARELNRMAAEFLAKARELENKRGG